MTYNPNIPLANDDLSDSQGQILANFNKANTSFGVDHYTFADLTTNNGKHNKVTTPAFVASPPTSLPPTTAANEPIFYAFQDSAPVGVIQYSRGPSNAVPSPVTNLQSPAAAIVLAPGASTNVLDFTGLSRAICTLYALDFSGPNLTQVRSATIYFWTGAAFTAISLHSGTPSLTPNTTGNIVRLTNNSGNPMNGVYWTLTMQRLS